MKAKKSLTFDGSAEREVSTLDNKVSKIYQSRILQIAKKLQVEFPEVKDIFFIEVAKRAYEFIHKRNRDESSSDLALHFFDQFDGVENFVPYLQSLAVGRYLTKSITIKYINPLLRSSEGEDEKYRKQEELKAAPIKTIKIEGGQLIGLIEKAIAENLDLAALKEIIPFQKKKASLFGIDNIRKDRFYAQYSKAACKEITSFIAQSEALDKTKKAITIRALEFVCLIQRYDDLILEKVERKLEDWKKTKKEIDLEKIEKERLVIEDITRNELPRGLWVSRTFTSLNR
jgi:hypothetical protein